MAEDADRHADAALFAVDALDDVDRARLLRELAQAPADERASFDAEVAAAREALACLSHATATEPPPDLRAQLLRRVAEEDPAGEVVPPSTDDDLGSTDWARWKFAAAAAAAAVVLGAGGAVLGYSIANREGASATSTADEIFAAPDVRTTSGEVAGGRATVTYSPSTGEGILVMNQVPRPAPGTIYQMWLDGPSGPRLAGTMSETDVAPSTTAVIHDMGGATAVTFTVGNAAEPTVRVGEPVASLPLS